MISETQNLLLMLIEKNSFNNFSGPSVVRDLREHTGLWRSVLMTQFVRPLYQKLENPVTSPSSSAIPIYHKASLLALRDIPNDRYAGDTLIIQSEPGQQGPLEELAARWKADEGYWIFANEALRAMGRSLRNSKEFTSEDRVLYVLWWD